MKIEINQNIIIGFYKDCWRVRSRKKNWTFNLWSVADSTLFICSFGHEGESQWFLFGFYKPAAIENFYTGKKRENVLFYLFFGYKEVKCLRWAKKWVYDLIPEDISNLCT